MATAGRYSSLARIDELSAGEARFRIAQVREPGAGSGSVTPAAMNSAESAALDAPLDSLMSQIELWSTSSQNRACAFP